MAASAILDKFSSTTSQTMTLANLASSTAGVGRQCTLLDNTTNRYMDILQYLKVQSLTATVHTANTSVQVYLLRASTAGTPTRTDAAGASDAALTVKNARLLGILRFTVTTVDEVTTGDFLINRPGPTWGIAVVQDSGQNLNTTEGNHIKEFIGLNPEAQ